MSETQTEVIRNYARTGLEETILGTLRRIHGALDGLGPDALAPIDAFHIRGRESTVELAELVGNLSGASVLDVGCGLGGTSRFLASHYDCRVSGIDLTPAYVELAGTLSGLVGLDDATRFQEASATALPFADDAFDVVWMEHVQMNIEAKDLLARELARVARPGGRVAFHEIFSPTDRAPHFPVPWAEVSTSSFLVPPDRFRGLLEASGLRAATWRDVTGPANTWLAAMLEKLRETGPPPLGVHLLMGESAPVRFANLARNLTERRVCVFQAVFEKA